MALSFLSVVMTNENVNTTTTTTNFVTIGSNSKTATTATPEDTTFGNSTSNETKPVVHAVNAQARKIEMTKLASSADVTASLKNPSNTGSFVISTTMIAVVAVVILVVIASVVVGKNIN